MHYQEFTANATRAPRSVPDSVANRINVEIDEYDQYTVRLFIGAAFAENLIDRWCGDGCRDEGEIGDAFYLFDGQRGSFVALENRDWREPSVSVAYNDERGHFIAFHGTVTREGDDRLDHTSPATRLGTDDFLAVVRLAKLFLELETRQ